jgi:transposase
MLAGRIDFVLGVDTHKHTHTAAVVTPAGGLLAHLTPLPTQLCIAAC